MSILIQLYVLVWKNVIQIFRHPVKFLLEILLHVLLLLVVCYMRSDLEKYQGVHYEPFKIFDNHTFCRKFSGKIAAYSPADEFFRFVMAKICRDLKIVGFHDDYILNHQIETNESFISSLAFAVIFETSNSTLITDLRITIRLPTFTETEGMRPWRTTSLHPDYTMDVPTSPEHNIGGEPYYHSRGFLFLQHAITLAAFNESRETVRNLQMQRLPYDKWETDKFYTVHNVVLIALLLPMPFIVRAVCNVQDMVDDKERQTQVFARALGVPVYVMWISWIISNLLVLLPICGIITLLLTIQVFSKAVFFDSDPKIIFLFFFLSSCSLIAFTFMVSALYSTGMLQSSSVIFTTQMYFLLMIPSFIWCTMYLGSSMYQFFVLGTSLSFVTATTFGICVIAKLEAVEQGIHWSNLNQPPTTEFQVPLLQIFLMLIIDTFFYLLVALLMEGVYVKICQMSHSIEEPLVSPKQNKENYEEFSGTNPTGVKIKNLSKIFKDHIVVNNLSLQAYENNIFVLVGHKGAGKTCTMSMIAGITAPTAGSVKIYGYNMKEFRNKIGNVGVCFENNVLFNDLTVAEHLYLSCVLKGAEMIKEEIENNLEMLGLIEKAKSKAHSLSNEMKRKLCIGMALCAHSKLVILDEPTAALDPSAQKDIWKLLALNKTGRTILVTTQSLDEANVLGDQIAVMRSGQIQCYGSLSFLKKKYCSGYFLILDVAPQCQPKQITNFLESFLNQAVLYSHIGVELTYKLSNDECSKFEDMFKELDRNLKLYKIRSYELSPMSLDVFFKVGADQEIKLLKTIPNKEPRKYSSLINAPMTYLTGASLMRAQAYAMCLKVSAVRLWYLLVAVVLLQPFVLTILLLWNQRFIVLQVNATALNISLDSYISPGVVLHGESNRYFTEYEKMLKSVPIRYVTEDVMEILDPPTSLSDQRQYIAGASFLKTDTVAWFNGELYHSQPLSLALILNAFYQDEFMGPNSSLTYVNYPLPLTTRARLHSIRDRRGFILATSVVCVTTAITAYYVVLLVDERVTKFKTLQILSGLRLSIFWEFHLLYDLLLYLVSICGITIGILVMSVEGFKHFDELAWLYILLGVYAIFDFPFLYCLSLPCQTTPTAIVMVVGVNVLGITSHGLLRISEDEWEKLSLFLRMLLPSYLLMHEVNNLSTTHKRRKFCLRYGSLQKTCKTIPLCCDLQYYALKQDGFACHLVICLCMGILWFIILIAIEYCLWYHRSTSWSEKEEDFSTETVLFDEDVNGEYEKIKNSTETDLKSYAVALENVTYYSTDRAVDGMCLGVQQRECFGLLGVDGSGKTTTLQLITGEISPLYGQVWALGYNTHKHFKYFHKIIGYCPKVDALLNELTPRETLKIFVLIRGVPLQYSGKLIEHLAAIFHFTPHLDKKVSQLSRGNKRKLSIAIATISEPEILCLDEPTSGMDLESKRLVWNSLAKLRKYNFTIILTSQDMEECEALCTRMAIMSKGQFQCLGSTDRLKKKFGKGYNVTIKLQTVDNMEQKIQRLLVFFEKTFPKAQLKVQYQEVAVFEIPDGGIPLRRIFGVIERKKAQLNIEEYTVGHCGLKEVVFWKLGQSPDNDY